MTRSISKAHKATCVVLLGFSFVCLSIKAHANLLDNADFESPVLSPGGFINIAVSGEPVGFSWVVSAGNVDLADLPNPFIDFDCFEGKQCLDLNGTTRGTLSQTFSSEIGQSYRLSFVYSDNSVEAGISSADIDVTDVGSSSSLLHAAIEHSTANNGTGLVGDGDGDFMTFIGYFTATGTTTRLTLTSTSASASASGGILLDDFMIVEGLAGDFDFDGDVDGRDFLIWQRGGSPDPLSTGDLSDWQGNYGAGSLSALRLPPSAIETAVPEPSAVMLAFIAIVALSNRCIKVY